MERLGARRGLNLPKWLAWTLTFAFINVTWVFFRAGEMSTALRLLKGMSGLGGLGLGGVYRLKWAILLILLLIGVILGRSAQPVTMRGWKTVMAMAVIFVFSLFFLNRITPFLYFNF